MKAGDRMTFTLMPDGVVVFRVKNKSVMTLADRLHNKGRKAVPVEQLSRLPLWRPLGQQSLELLQHVRHSHGDCEFPNPAPRKGQAGLLPPNPLPAEPPAHRHPE